jgi:biopolymer transport protein ExbD
VQLYADQAVPYGLVAQVMGVLSQSGLSQLRFASLPSPSTP